ncbi:MAG: phosphoribosyltransferase family protein [Candidatus Levybacteria bacterium]|nr:phosphoribosyltransferase family protein [Candidatus Levybacteria bacterium]
MYFKNRTEAGEMLAQKLGKYANRDVVVYALPRGGVVTAVEIAKHLHAPLEVVITRKIGHPTNPEYAIAAISENGHMVTNRSELASIEEDFLQKEIEKQREEIKRRKEMYLGGREIISTDGKIAILVDDGVATGLTLRVGIIELRHRNPKKIVIAVPIVSKSTADVLKNEIDELIALEIPSDDVFLSSVGDYYENFKQVEDSEVIEILDAHRMWLKSTRVLRVAR